MRWNAVVLLSLVIVIGLVGSPLLAVALLLAGPVLWVMRRRMPLPESLDVPEELRVEVDQLVSRAGIEPVDVIVTTSGAHAGSLPGRQPGAVLLRSDLAEWPAPLRRAVLAHEIAHLRRGDFASVIIAMLASLATMLTSFRLCLYLAPQTPLGVLGGFAASLIVGTVLSVLVSSWIQRRVERRADTLSLDYTGDPEALADAIERIDVLMREEMQSSGKRTRQLPRWLERVVSTHPVTGDRVASLRRHASTTRVP